MLSKFYNVKGRIYADNDSFSRFWFSCFIETVNDELKTLRKWNTPNKDALTISSSTFRSNCCLLLVSKEAVHQYTKNH